MNSFVKMLAGKLPLEHVLLQYCKDRNVCLNDRTGRQHDVCYHRAVQVSFRKVHLCRVIVSRSCPRPWLVPSGVGGWVSCVIVLAGKLSLEQPSQSYKRLDISVDRTGLYRCGGKGQVCRKASGSRGSEILDKGSQHRPE